MKTADVVIGEKTYTIREAKRKANAKWRQRFQAEFTDVAALIEGLPKTDLTAEALGGLLHQIVAKVGGSVDTLAVLVFDYSPELAADQQTIEEEAYDSEIMAAFTAVLKLAYPFGAVLEALSGLVALGRTDRATLPSSS
ncbi:MAG: hypothetical protein H6661_10080 [Ardenticatenaceae bacterium]|nr:hypothetical protein [Ardenticatenaceae bacterium]